MAAVTAKILHVDLGTRTTRVEEIAEPVLRRYLGGGGLAAYLLLRDMPAGVDPLGPDNVLVFTTSIINGLSLSGTNRYTAAAKSPLTGGYGESEAGGWWAPELRAAGYDGITVRGRAESPVVPLDQGRPGRVPRRPAVLGKLSGEVQEGLEQELGDKRIRVLQTGISGERGVRFAAIVNQLKHFHGRCGLGAVMGAKNLKAIAVRGIEDQLAGRQGRGQVRAHLLQGALRPRPRPLPPDGHGGRPPQPRGERDPADPELPRRLLRARQGDQRPEDGGDHPREPRDLLRLHGGVQAGGRGEGARRDAAVRRARVRVPRRHRIALRGRRPQRARQDQPAAGAVRAGLHFHGGRDRLRDGVLRARHHHQGRHGRGRARLGQRRGGGADGPPDRPPGRDRRAPRRGRQARGGAARPRRRAVRDARQGAGAPDARSARQEEPGARVRALAHGGGSHGGAARPALRGVPSRWPSARRPRPHRAGEDARPRAPQGAGVLLHAAGLELLQLGGDVRLRGDAAQRAGARAVHRVREQRDRLEHEPSTS